RPRSSGCRASRGSGGRGRKSFALLGQVEVVVLALERERAPVLAVLARQALRSFYPTAEAHRRTSQLELGIDVELARDVHRGEQNVAELVRREVLLELAHLVVEVGDRTVEIRILEADGLGTLLHLARVQERGQRLRDVVE